MGDYNPHFPYILGQELAPIRQDPFKLTPGINVQEAGHTLELTASRTVTEGRYYLRDYAQVGIPFGTTYNINVYPLGREALSGPIQQVVIPCNAGAITGDFSADAGLIPARVYTPNDSSFVTGYVGGTTACITRFFFATNAYSQELQGKRILKVNVLYQFRPVAPISVAAGWTQQLQWGIAENNTIFDFLPLGEISALGRIFGAMEAPAPNDALGESFNNALVSRASIGEVNPLWPPRYSSGGGSATVGREVAGWTYEQLQRFEISSGVDRMSVMFKSALDTSDQFLWQVGYMALEVFFCEENRSSTGYWQPNPSANLGVTAIPMRHPVTRVASPALAAGQYVSTIVGADMGDYYSTGGFLVSNEQPPTHNALQFLYPLVSHAGVRVNHPVPMDVTAIGKTFTSETSLVQPQVTLHTSTTPLAEDQVYGEQVQAQVYGTIYAEQVVEDTNIGSRSYDQVRFYARRFGDTAVPLYLHKSTDLVTPVASISPVDFDSLTEIVDGWKEVTVPCTAQTFTGTRPSYRWQAVSELAGNRWEVLGASAPALTAFPGNLLFQYLPATQQLPSATYGAPSNGTTDFLTWMKLPSANPVSGSASDTAADATLLFSMTMPTVTGFGLTMQNQALSGLGYDCAGSAPCCIPTSINYNQVTWGGNLSDMFGRSVTGGWGSADSGQAWTTSITTSSVYVSGGIAFNNIATSGTSIQDSVTGHTPDVELYYETIVPSIPTNATAQHSGMLRRADSTNYYLGDVAFTSSGTFTVTITKRDGGGFTPLTTSVTAGTYGQGSRIAVKFQAVANTLRLKAWRIGLTEPPWQATVADTTFPVATGAGVRTNTDNNFGPIPWLARYDNVCLYPVQVSDGGYYEVQRWDPLTDWQTIAKGDGCVYSFNDYEARVGMASSYRIRMVDAYNFAGSWATAASGIIPSPGVSGSACLNGTGTLIFTSNYSQTGAYNLAYTEVWEGSSTIPVEEFSFPEAGTVDFGRMYQRDFQVAFKGTERVGDVFSRTLLVNAAAISPEKLSDFTSLRDMAWAQVPYVCVRDELGDRWFAAVQVPDGNVRRNRRLYMAPVTITEVTATAYPVQP